MTKQTIEPERANRPSAEKTAQLTHSQATVTPPPINQDQWRKTTTVSLSADKPIQIAVDTPTDWPATVITPLVIAIVAAWFTVINQRFQVRSTTANFRHSWQIELRSAVTNYIGSALEINMRCARELDFLSKPDAEPFITKLTTNRALIRVMLDKNKSYTKEMIDLMDEISDNLDDRGDIFDKKISEFTNKAQEVLELAWNDIRKDLRGEKK